MSDLTPGVDDLAQPTLSDFRVLFAYINADGQDRFEFTTVLATDPADAIAALAGVHSLDYGYQAVQVVPSNGVHTGFNDEGRQAAINEAAARRLAGLDA